MIEVLKKTWWVMGLVLFLAFFNIGKTYLLIEDTARDSVRMIEIWQKKELTLVGPPASLGQRSEKEFYLGSLSYYLGIVGLVATNFEVWGAVVMQVLIFVSSIPVFYLLLSKELKVKEPLLGLLIYSLSPLVITHLRFYWNPNAIFGLATWFWYLVANKKYLWAGILAGLISNLHYMAVLPLLVCGLLSMNFWMGLLLGTAPTWIFELRNEFFLSKTFWFNLTHRAGAGIKGGWFVEGFDRFWSAIVGLRPMEIGYGAFLEGTWQKVLGIILVLLVVWVGMKLKGKQKLLFGLTIISAGLVGLISGGEYYGRYLFGLYPVFVWLLVLALEKTGRVGFGVILALMMITNWKTLQARPTSYVSVVTLERASQMIKEDDPKGKYNLSENIYGDAQARGLRYFVWRNVANKPENEVSYGWLSALYVLSPSLDKIKKDNRYEFYAPNLTKLSWEKDLGEVKLFKFVSD
jgi:hypothetical protein